MYTANRPPGQEAFSPVQLCGSGPHDIGSAERAHAQAAAVVTYMYVDTPELIEDLLHRKASQHGSETLVPLDAENNGKLLLPVRVGEETIIPGLLETGRKDMHHEPADELTAGKGDILEGRIVLIAFRHKGDEVSINRLHPGVSDGDTVGITPQIFNGIAEAGLPDIRAPGGIVKPVFQGSPGGWVCQGGTGGGEGKLPAFIKGVQGGKKLPPELRGKDFSWNKEAIAAGLQLPVRGEATPGDDAVDMGMEVQLLPPGMEDLDDAWGGAQELPVCGELQEGLCGAFVEEGVQKGLVGVNQCVQLYRDGEDHMEIRGIDDLGLACIHPQLL